MASTKQSQAKSARGKKSAAADNPVGVTNTRAARTSKTPAKGGLHEVSKPCTSTPEKNNTGTRAQTNPPENSNTPDTTSTPGSAFKLTKAQTPTPAKLKKTIIVKSKVVLTLGDSSDDEAEAPALGNDSEVSDFSPEGQDEVEGDDEDQLSDIEQEDEVEQEDEDVGPLPMNRKRPRTPKTIRTRAPESTPSSGASYVPSPGSKTSSKASPKPRKKKVPTRANPEPESLAYLPRPSKGDYNYVPSRVQAVMDKKSNALKGLKFVVYICGTCEWMCWNQIEWLVLQHGGETVSPKSMKVYWADYAILADEVPPNT